MPLCSPSPCIPRSLPDPDPTQDWRSPTLLRQAGYATPSLLSLTETRGQQQLDAMLRVATPAPALGEAAYRLPVPLRQAQQFDRPTVPPKLRGKEVARTQDMAPAASVLAADEILAAINLEVHSKAQGRASAPGAAADASAYAMGGSRLRPMQHAPLQQQQQQLEAGDGGGGGAWSAHPDATLLGSSPRSRPGSDSGSASLPVHRRGDRELLPGLAPGLQASALLARKPRNASAAAMRASGEHLVYVAGSSACVIPTI